MTLQGTEFESTGIWRCERVLLVLVFCFGPLGCGGGGGGGIANPPPAATTSAGPTPTEHFATKPRTGMFADNSSTAPTDEQCADIVPAMSETVPENQATHPDDLQIGITAPVNQKRAITTDLARARSRLLLGTVDQPVLAYSDYWAVYRGHGHDFPFRSMQVWD